MLNWTRKIFLYRTTLGPVPEGETVKRFDTIEEVGEEEEGKLPVGNPWEEVGGGQAAGGGKLSVGRR